MAEPVLIMGQSGTGKSTSLRNLNPAETIIISPNAKSLPFKGGRAKYIKGKNFFNSNNLDAIQKTIAKISKDMPDIKQVIIEDFTHFFSARIFSDEFLSRNSGGEAFQRWNEFGASVYQAIFSEAQNWREDLIIGVIHHTEVKDDGTVGFKSAGKLLDNTIDFPSYFTWIFHTLVMQKDEGAQYVMQTNRSAGRHAKSPMEAFDDLYIPNDLNEIFSTIRAYNVGEESAVVKTNK